MIKLPQGIRELSGIYERNGYRLYLVGGFVRNLVLGLSGGDLDICSCAPPFEAALFLRSAGLSVIDKAPELGTIEVHIKIEDKKHIFEHTTFRRDFYPAGGEHRPERVEFTRDMREDAARRDFTVNALYLDINTGEIIDPTGCGIKDAGNAVLRAAADDPEITIRDDGLRIMRMARFAAELDFAVSEDLMDCAVKHASMLSDVSAERKRDELKKILLADIKYPEKKNRGAALKGLMLLKRIGALPYVLPALSRTQGTAQWKQYHEYDVLDHCIHTCDASPPILKLRLAALLHDIGKPGAIEQSGSMYGHDKLGAELAEADMEFLRFENSIKKDVAILVRSHMFDLEGRARPIRIRRQAVRLGKKLFEMLIVLRRADFWGSGKETGPVKSADNWQRELERMQTQGVPWSIKELKITGGDIVAELKIPPSPAVGEIIDKLFALCVADPRQNKREKLLLHAARLREELLP